MNFLKWFIFSLTLAGSVLHAAGLTLRLDPTQSQIQIEVRATVDSFTGTLPTYDAVIQIDPATQQVTAARFSFLFAAVQTGKTDRDEQMLTWAEATKHPDGEFELVSLTSLNEGHFQATGTLKLHGVSQSITFPISVTHEGTRYAIDGTVTLDTRDYALPIIRKFMVLKVDPLVTVRFHLQGELTAP